MEILSIGEKIKRARVYKGYTLKNLCDNKISVSKMSCIENGKITPEDWILKLVSEKLNIELDYLKKDIKEQIEENMKNLNNFSKKSDYESKLKYNLEYADDYGHYDLAFSIMHLLFKYYLDKKEVDVCEKSTSKYYNVCVKSKNDKNRLIYYYDIGKMLYASKEYFQAKNYFENVCSGSDLMDSNNYDIILKSMYMEAKCYLIIGEYKKAYEKSEKLLNYFENIKDKKYQADVYSLLCVLNIKEENDKFKEYEKKSFNLCKEGSERKAKFLYDYGCAMVGGKLNSSSYEYIMRAIDIFPKENKFSYVDFMLDVISTLIKMNKIEKAQELNDMILNYSIDLGNNLFIEKSYYFKALIMIKNGQSEMAEMYMNLSLDILSKIGNKAQIYNRYFEMGVLYFNLNNTEESLEYFSAAINLDKKIL